MRGVYETVLMLVQYCSPGAARGSTLYETTQTETMRLFIYVVDHEAPWHRLHIGLMEKRQRRPTNTSNSQIDLGSMRQQPSSGKNYILTAALIR